MPPETLGSSPANSSDPYEFGSLWVLSFIRVKPGYTDKYLRELGPVRKKLMDGAMKKGFVLSHKILNGFASNHEDWDFLFMVEYKSWAALDSLKYELESLNEQFVGSAENVVGLLETRSEIRQQLGDKPMREIILK